MATKRVLFLSIATALALTGCYEREEPADPTAGAGTDGAGDASNSDGNSGDDDDGNNDDDSDDGGTGGDTDGDSDDDGDDDGDSDTGADASGLDELIQTLCEWDFQCCSEGEIDYRLGPFTVDAADCTERFVQQLESNDNEDAETPRGDLLYVLGFAVRLDRSEPDPQMVSDCRDQLEGRQCNEPYGDEWYCTEADDPADSPCDLRNMFTGKLDVGDHCSGALAGLGYDIECQPGSSCEEMDGTFICVDKGLDGEFCEADHTCDQGLFCDISSGRCAPKRDVGQACAFEDNDDPDVGTETIPCLEHLSCSPDTLTCVRYCSEWYDCSVDSQCAEGHSCIPVEIGPDAETFTYCLERGEVNGDRCDTERDCADNFHCDGGSCAFDRAQGMSCTAENQCQAGLYCDLGGSGDCEIVNNSNESCAADRECNPSTTLGCITSDDGQECRPALLGNGDVCVPGENSGSISGNWCASGVCEDTSDDGIYNPECHTGANVGEDCDEDDGTVDTDRCRRGTYCEDEICREKLDSGGNCHDDGADECLNGHCVGIWEGDYCSDLTPAGDLSVVTCDGQD